MRRLTIALLAPILVLTACLEVEETAYDAAAEGDGCDDHDDDDHDDDDHEND